MDNRPPFIDDNEVPEKIPLPGDDATVQGVDPADPDFFDPDLNKLEEFYPKPVSVDHTGQVVLITGAGRGAGRELALEFAARGAAVAANDITPINVDPVVAEIVAKGGRAKAYIADVAKKVAAQAMVNDVLADFGRIDILINHARVEPSFPLLEIDEWDWHRTLDVNLTGAFLMTQSVARVMKTQKGGAIFYLIALAGRLEEPGRVASAASLSGLAGLTLQAAAELEPFGIRVNAVSQGFSVDQFPDVNVDAAYGLSPDAVGAIMQLCTEFSSVTRTIVPCSPFAGEEEDEEEDLEY